MQGLQSKKPIIKIVYIVAISLIFFAFIMVFYFSKDIQNTYKTMQDQQLEVILTGSRLKSLFSTQQIQLAKFLEDGKTSDIYFIQGTKKEILRMILQLESENFNLDEQSDYGRLMRTNEMLGVYIDALLYDDELRFEETYNLFLSASSSINLAIVFTDRILDSQYRQYNKLRLENDLKSRVSNIVTVLGGLTALFTSLFFYRFLTSKVSVLEVEGSQDSLTSLYNKRVLENYLKSMQSDSSESDVFSIAIMDIDHFKKVNDTYGHMFGDIIIKQIALKISSSIRPTDVAFRFGGEEFLIVFPQTNLEDAYKVCERIRTGIENEKYQHDLSEVNVTITIGLAESACKTDYHETITWADQNLYKGKRSGRNRTVL